jgi:chromosome segregation ATPase
MSLKEKLKINKLALDKELQEIPADLQEYGELHSQMASKKDKTKLQIETLQARLTNKISKDWKELGFAKSPTVAQIDAFIKTDEEYQKLSEKLLDIQEELSYYNATLNSLQAKRSALGNLVSLFMTQYWSDVPLETQQNKLGDTMRRRKRKE